MYVSFCVYHICITDLKVVTLPLVEMAKGIFALQLTWESHDLSLNILLVCRVNYV